MEGINSSSSSAGGNKQSRKATLKKALFRHFRSARIHHKNKSSRSNNLLTKTTAIARASGQEGLERINVLSQSTQENNGVVRMKILVRKEDLDKVLEIMRNNNNSDHNETENCVNEEEEQVSLLIEERLNLLRRKHRRHNSWSPALQTIQEDILA